MEGYKTWNLKPEFQVKTWYFTWPLLLLFHSKAQHFVMYIPINNTLSPLFLWWTSSCDGWPLLHPLQSCFETYFGSFKAVFLYYCLDWPSCPANAIQMCGATWATIEKLWFIIYCHPLNRGQPNGFVYEPIWTVSQSLPNLHTHLMHA